MHRIVILAKEWMLAFPLAECILNLRFRHRSITWQIEMHLW